MHKKIVDPSNLSRTRSPDSPKSTMDVGLPSLTISPGMPFATRSDVTHKRVLYYRDDSTPSKLIETSLTAREFRVIVVHDLDELNEEWHWGTCDIVLLDHSLSISEKLFFLDSTRDRKPSLPVIMMFDPGENEEAAHAKAGGAADCVIRDEFGEYLIQIPALIEVYARESSLRSTDELEPSTNEPSDTADSTSNTMRIDLSELAAEVRGTSLHTVQASFVVLSGPDVGKTFQLEGVSCTIGRDPSCQLMLCDESVSRFHAGIKLYPNGVITLKDLDSTNGTFIGGKRIRLADLREGDKILVGRNTLIGFQLNDAIDTSFHEELYQQSTRDGLTGISNRRHCLERIRSTLAYAKRHGRPVSILMFDVDHFKHINDEFGHRTGDMVLQTIANITCKSIREEDILGRYGGEEFILFALDTDLDGAVVLAERIRKKIEHYEMRTDEAIPRTVFTSVSIGIATSDKSATYEMESLIQYADENLYRAKDRGRNCTVASVIPPDPTT